MILIDDNKPLTSEQKDECARKGIKIQAVLTYLQNEVREFNKEKQRLNLPGEYRTFCYGTMFLKLAFMDDADLDFIATKILG